MDSSDKYAPEGGNDGSANQHGRGLRVGGWRDKLSSVGNVSEWTSFGVNLAYDLWLFDAAKGVRNSTSEQGEEVRDKDG